MSNPQISVIVPVYNAEKYLRRCVDSIFAQTFTDFEVLLIDDGSTDASGAICDEYALADARVRVLHKPNGGVSSARNLGLDNACGEWIAFIDADDWVAPDYLYEMYNKANLETSDIVTCDLSIQGDNISEYVSTFDWRDNTSKAIGEYIISGYTSVWASICKKSLYDDNNLFFPEGIKYCEDLHLLFRLYFFANKISVCHKSLYFYWQHSLSVVHNKSEETDAHERWVIEELMAFSNRHGILNDVMLYLSWRYLYASIPMLRDPNRFKEFKKGYRWRNVDIIKCSLISKRQKLIAWFLAVNMRTLALIMFKLLRYIKRPV